MAERAGDVRFDLTQLRVARNPLLVPLGEPLAHLRQLGLDPARERCGVLGRTADERGGTRHPVAQHLGAEPARLGRRPRAAVEGVGERALGVRERHVDLVGRPAARDELALGLVQLVLAERDRERSDGGLPRLDRFGVVLPRPFPEFHARDDNLRRMATEQVVEEVRGERDAYAGVMRFYELAKRQEWQVRDLPWGEIPPIPEGKGTPQRKARRQDMWRSVLTQQLQADMLACEMASQLLNVAPDPEAKLYYSTMVQDESRHTEAWLKLINDVGGIAERDPYLDELAHMTLEADTLEEKVFQMQVFYERLIISRFRLIARASPGTVLEDVCNRLATDDGIHHGAGMAYERVLLEDAPRKTKQRLVDAANRLLPIFVKHALWRPKERAVIGRLMYERDVQRLHEDLEEGVKLAESLGLDVSDVQMPAL